MHVLLTRTSNASLGECAGSAGFRAAISCASAELLFHNGCGGQGTLTHRGRAQGIAERSEAGRRSNLLWASEFPPPVGLRRVRDLVDQAQRGLQHSAAGRSAARRVRELLPAEAAAGGCVPDCAKDASIARTASAAADFCAQQLVAAGAGAAS